jgi:hypothetical protein
MLHQVKQIQPNIHLIEVDGKTAEFLLISDLHWDNPKCDRALLKKHLDQAVERNAPIIVNGDFFCLMQGKGDPRRSKDEIRPEHNKGNYLQAVVEDAVEWFAPYAQHLALIGYGNHETSVLRHTEFDALRQFQAIFNYKHGTNVQIGGYGGTIQINMDTSTDGDEHSRNTAFIIHYFHGSGGGGPVTKGVIQDQRMMANTEGYDLTWQGHVHELYHHINMVHHYNRTRKMISHRRVHQLRTSTYKEEFGAGEGGFHVERGRAVKPLGGYWMTLNVERIIIKVNDKMKDTRIIDAKFHTT